MIAMLGAQGAQLNLFALAVAGAAGSAHRQRQVGSNWRFLTARTPEEVKARNKKRRLREIAKASKRRNRH